MSEKPLEQLLAENNIAPAITLAELLAPPSDESMDRQVIPHNTMRFDVQLAHVQPMIDDGEVTTEQIANAIRSAIEKAVDETVGSGLDGTPIPGGNMGCDCKRTKYLHRELVAFDLS